MDFEITLLKSLNFWNFFLSSGSYSKHGNENSSRRLDLLASLLVKSKTWLEYVIKAFAQYVYFCN